MAEGYSNKWFDIHHILVMHGLAGFIGMLLTACFAQYAYDYPFLFVRHLTKTLLQCRDRRIRWLHKNILSQRTSRVCNPNHFSKKKSSNGRTVSS